MRLFRRKPSRKRLENIIVDLHREASALRRSEEVVEKLEKNKAPRYDITRAEAVVWMNQIDFDDELERIGRFIRYEIASRR